MAENFNKYKSVLNVLDKVELGLCIVADNARVVVRNTEARRIFLENRGIRVSDSGRVFCQQAEQDVLLQNAIADASLSAVHDAADCEKIIYLDDKNGMHSVLVEVSTLMKYSKNTRGKTNPVLIMLIDLLSPRCLSVKRAIGVYGLTEAEGGVCQLLVEGYSTLEMAENRNVSLETVKSQIKSILRKTGCTRRAEIVNLVIKSSPSFK